MAATRAGYDMYPGSVASAMRAPGVPQLGPFPDEWHCLLSHMRPILAMVAPGLLAWWMLVRAMVVGLGLLWFESMLDWLRWSIRCLARMADRGGLRDVLRREPGGSLVLTAVVRKLAWEQAFGRMPGG